MRTTRTASTIFAVSLLLSSAGSFAACFVVQQHSTFNNNVAFVSPSKLWMAATKTEDSTTAAAVTAPVSFIDTQLRGAAMRLHTREQAPKEGQAAPAAPAKQQQRYTPTHADYLTFLVDSKHVYEALEDIVYNGPLSEELAVFQNTGLERTVALEHDIQFMVSEYGLDRPSVAAPGRDYAAKLRQITSLPELVCHYYNFYFAHTAGGRMIGKQMSALLLDKKTLEFYKWDGDLNTIKATVKESIEAMAAQWSPAEQQECVAGTAAAFQGGGGINSHLSGGQSAAH